MWTTRSGWTVGLYVRHTNWDYEDRYGVRPKGVRCLCVRNGNEFIASSFGPYALAPVAGLAIYMLDFSAKNACYRHSIRGTACEVPYMVADTWVAPYVIGESPA